MQQVDTLIIGQGLAGTLLAFALYKAGQSYVVIDAGHANSASRVAAGMFSPVSGKRKTILPGVIEQIDYAIDCYTKLEQLLQLSFLHQAEVFELPTSGEEQAALLKRANDPQYSSLFRLHPSVPSSINSSFHPIAVKQSGWVDCAVLINGFRQWLNEINCIKESLFDYNALQLTNEGFVYGNISCRNICFCEGYRAAANPFFSDSKLIPCKGDIINIACYPPNTTNILKQSGYYLLPKGAGEARVGATFKWDNANDVVQEEDRQVLLHATAAMMPDSTIQITAHQTAIRATTADRSPVAISHPQIKGMYQLNGLGAKGIILAPWLARQLAETMRIV